MVGETVFSRVSIEGLSEEVAGKVVLKLGPAS